MNIYKAATFQIGFDKFFSPRQVVPISRVAAGLLFSLWGLVLGCLAKENIGP
jgi:hypothetical protein